MRLLLAALALLTLITGYQTWRVHLWHSKHDAVYAQLVKERADAKAASEATDREWRAKEDKAKSELKEAMNESDSRTANLQATLAAERKSRTRLLDAFANFSGCPQATPSTALATASQAASAPEDLRTIVFSRIDDAAGVIAEYADKARIAGEACIAAYEVAR
jgi:ABC-type uncharacterized transport system YnjBCD substrate-binding protein